MSIWTNKLLKAQFPEETNLITLNEGNTPVDKINDDEIELNIKREDKNPSGSWKDRGTAYKLTSLLANNIHEAVLFSSGNALISLIKYSRELDLEFKINAVVSKSINPDKLQLIQSLISGTNNELIISESPKKDAIKISAEKQIPNLRVSIDNDIVKGYWSLGFEIYSVIKNMDNADVSIFVPASSGTALVGLAEGLFMHLGSEFKMPKIYVCQTQSIHPFVESEISDEKSKADAIVDSIGLRSSQIQKIVKETGGEVFAVTNDELDFAKNYIEQKAISNLSYNSLLSIAGFLKSSKSKMNICIASGR